MILAFVPRFALIWTVIFAMLLANVSVAEQRETTHNSEPRSERSEIAGDIGFSTLMMLSVVSLGRWLTPLDEWHAEIHKLTEDERFVERWMLLNDDPASLEKGNRAIAKIRKERKALEKKYNRFQWLYYPAVGIIGGGAMMLYFSLRGD